jgi:hypothetical protein
MLSEGQLKDIYEEFIRFSEQCHEKLWKEMKPWPEFFGTFKIPQRDMKTLEQRVSTNLDYYKPNYISICGTIIALQIIFAPVVFLVLVLCTVFSCYLLLIRKNPIVVGDTEITGPMKMYVCCGFTFLVMALSGVMVKLVWVTIYSGVLCLFHMLLRPRSVSSKTDKIYEDLKPTGSMWLDPESGHGSGIDGSTPRSRKATVQPPQFMSFTLPTPSKKD